MYPLVRMLKNVFRNAYRRRAVSASLSVEPLESRILLFAVSTLNPISAELDTNHVPCDLFLDQPGDRMIDSVANTNLQDVLLSGYFLPINAPIFTVTNTNMEEVPPYADDLQLTWEHSVTTAAVEECFSNYDDWVGA